MTNTEWSYKKRFDLPERDAKYSEKQGFVAGILMNGADEIALNVKETLFKLYTMCRNEWIPMFQTDNRYIREFPRCFDSELMRDRFEADMEDSGKILLMGSQESGLVAYVMVTPAHYIASMYVLPEYRRDRIAMSLLEMYINRFEAPELKATAYVLDKTALAFFERLGFKDEAAVYDHSVAVVAPRTVDLVWRAK